MRERLAQALARIDAINAEDPRTVVVDGVAIARELLYGQRMSAWLTRLAPDASEALTLAVRAQHVARFRVPRDTYPSGRAGYLAWRKDLADLHAEVAGEVLREVGYEPELVARVGSLLHKHRFKVDPEAQTLEDVACLVFLEHYFDEFAADHDDEKLVTIVQKTWRKMSDRGRSAAATLRLEGRARAIVDRAVSGAA